MKAVFLDADSFADLDYSELERFFSELVVYKQTAKHETDTV